MPIFVVTHYPLQTGDVDNWFCMTDVLRKYNIQAVLGGHYHRNALWNYDGLPGIIFRSTLRGTESVGGYSILSVSDSIRVFEKNIGQPELKWLTLPFETKKYEKANPNLRPSFEINKLNNNLHEVWRINTNAAIYNSPTVSGNTVFYGDDLGNMHCISLKNGSLKWKVNTGSRIISSSAVGSGRIIFGSTDGNIYCLNANTGKIIWIYETKKAVLGSPLIKSDTVFIGGSDGSFRALNLIKGSLIWRFTGLKGYVETRPVVAENKVYFGAWDANFYALNTKNGSLAWKWNNGQNGIHFSPAAVLPVYSNAKIFITAPDRYWTALDAETGIQIWRTNQHEVRESIGVSEDGNVVFSRCMNDSVVALNTRNDYPKVIWKKNAGYGYDHNPSMMVERDGVIVFGTKNGLLNGINAKTGAVLWRYKIGNSIINTVTLIAKNECILTTTEGVVARIKY
jgi:outer membrane protein assembly factor BamB